MSRHALINGRLVDASKLPNGTRADCHVCGEDVFVKAAESIHVNPYFSHYSGEGHSGESDDHHRMKWAIANALTDRGIDARIEVSVGERRADVMVFEDGIPMFAIEVQLAYQTQEKKIQRTESYWSHGINCTWLDMDDCDKLLAGLSVGKPFQSWLTWRIKWTADEIAQIKAYLEQTRQAWVEAKQMEMERIERERQWIEARQKEKEDAARRWEQERPERERLEAEKKVEAERIAAARQREKEEAVRRFREDARKREEGRLERERLAVEQRAKEAESELWYERWFMRTFGRDAGAMCSYCGFRHSWAH